METNHWNKILQNQSPGNWHWSTSNHFDYTVKGRACMLSHSVLSNSASPVDWLLCLWDSLGKNTGVGIHFLLQGNFLTQGSNPGLLHCRQVLYCLSHQGSPRGGADPWAHMSVNIHGLRFGLGGKASQMMCCAVLSCSLVSDSWDPMDCSPPDSSVHGNSPGKNTGGGCHALLQGIFPTQYCRRILYWLNHNQVSPDFPRLV